MTAFDPVTAAFDIGGKLIDRLWPDPSERDKAKLELMQMQQTGELAALTAETDLAKAQLEVNAEEAKNANIFVSGWRPAVGWTCAAAFAYHYVLQPLMAFILSAAGHPVDLPDFNMETMITVLIGMLGLGGLRTAEKFKGGK